MKFDKKQLRLRRYEVQVFYHSAYLFWNLKGVIAEKWGHGPYFGAYRHEPDQVTLTVKSGERSPLVGIYGLKASAIVIEDHELKEAQSLASQWLADCFEVLNPESVTRMWIRMFYSYPIGDRRQSVSDTMAKLYPGIDELTPSGYEQRHSGIQFQALDTTETGDPRLSVSGVIGVYGPQQAREWFSSGDVEDEWGLGVNYYRQVDSGSGFSDRSETLSLLQGDAKSESRHLVSAGLMKIINSA